MELTDRRGLHVTHCNTSLGLLKANAPAVPSVFHNTPPADAEDEALRTAPEDWRGPEGEQHAAIKQFPRGRDRRAFPPDRGADRVKRVSQEVKKASLKPFENQGLPVQFLRDPAVDKKQIARAIAAERKVESGLVCALSSME